MSAITEEKIVISDIRAPILSALQKQALAATAANPVSLDVATVLGAAKAETGLDDFGPDDGRERLQLWLDAINDQTDLVPLARTGLFMEIVRYCANRLRIEDVVKRHPEILDIVIDRPLVVGGLPRSGTTYLQNFVGSDPQLRSLPYWEAIRPVPASPAENGDPATDPRYARALEGWQQADALLPYLKMIHPFDPDHISEDVELQAIDFGSYLLEWLVPNRIWTDHYWSMDLGATTYRYMKKVLQVLTWHKGPNRWLLKCPQHLEQLPAIYSVFPDATFVLNHRDPVASIQSAITSLGYSARTRVDKIDLDAISSYWIERYEKLLGACVRDHDKLPAEQVEDVYFDKLMKDPITVIERIYATASLPISDDLRARWQAFMDENQRGKHGSLDYNLRRDFGLEPAEVREHFRFYYDKFPVREEVK